MEIKLNDKEIKLECNAFSTVLYEDTFKGRNFFRDYENALAEAKASNHIRFLWCFAKTADNSIEDFETFSRNNNILESISEVISVNVQLIAQSLSSSIPKKKSKMKEKFSIITQRAKS